MVHVSEGREEEPFIMVQGREKKKRRRRRRRRRRKEEKKAGRPITRLDRPHDRTVRLPPGRPAPGPDHPVPGPV